MANNRVISAVLTLKDKNFGTTAKKSASSMKDFERRTKHATNSIKDFGRTATSSFKSVATGAASIVAALGITKALSKAFGMVKGSITNAFDRIDTMEQFKNVMQVMTGSTEKANAALQATKDIVTGTAFGLDVAAGAVQGFVTGGMKVEDATRILGSFSDAVAFYTKGTNEELDTVTDALIKMSTKGKVNMEQLGRIMEAGIPAIDIYAEAMGKGTKEVADAISKGKISAKSFMDVMDEALANGTTKFPALEGAAKKAGASWRGTFDNMRAAVTRGTTGIIEKIDAMLKENGLPDMRSMVSLFGKKFEAVLGSVADKIPIVADVLMALYKKSKPGLDWLKDVAFNRIKDAVSGFGDRVLVVRDWAVEAFQNIKTRIQENSPVIEGVKGVVQDLGDKAIELKGWMLEAFESARPSLDWLKDEGLPLVVDGIAKVIEKATDAYNYINDNWNLISPIVYGIATAIGVYKAGMVIAAIATNAMTIATTGMAIAQGALNAVLAISPFGWVAIAIGAVVAAGVLLYKNWDTIKLAAQILWDKVKDVGGGIRTAFESAWGAVKEAAANSINFVIDKINGLIKAINKIPGVNVPIIAKVDWGAAETAAPQGKVAGGSVMASYAVGTNRVNRDQVAAIHKDEMIVPARQARNLRQQGVTIDNIDKKSPITMSRSGGNNNIINININGVNKSTNEIINELVPQLKHRLANL